MKQPAPPPERKQTTTLVLLLRYSRTQVVQGARYLSSSAVVCAEFLKIITCVAVLLWNNGFSVPALVLQLRNEVWRQPIETSKMLVPAGLYTIQNNLLFYALSLLDAATYQVTYQLKILTTAMFSVWMLNRRISKQQWSSLVLLIVGVALVQMPTGKAPETALEQGPYQFLGPLGRACVVSVQWLQRHLLREDAQGDYMVIVDTKYPACNLRIPSRNCGHAGV
ncbi:hypothetical protein MTO96_047894 [Rhipicephalus appendiculatus]